MSIETSIIQSVVIMLRNLGKDDRSISTYINNVIRESLPPHQGRTAIDVDSDMLHSVINMIHHIEVTATKWTNFAPSDESSLFSYTFNKVRESSPTELSEEQLCHLLLIELARYLCDDPYIVGHNMALLINMNINSSATCNLQTSLTLTVVTLILCATRRWGHYTVKDTFNLIHSHKTGNNIW